MSTHKVKIPKEEVSIIKVGLPVKMGIDGKVVGEVKSVGVDSSMITVEITDEDAIKKLNEVQPQISMSISCEIVTPEKG